MNERSKQIEALFHAASELGSGEEPQAYLEQACANDPSLRNEVEALLKAASEAEPRFAQHQQGWAASTIKLDPILEHPGSIIGRYKLLEKIGEGGMGIVYMAEQREPVVRKVALKIIKVGMDTRQVIARFEAEQQALALMDHPNIAKVLDAGATETGRPFFVMELVQGVPITDFCDQNRLSTTERAKLFIPVCQAIQSAHQKGVIHRDLKPSNILVTLNGGVPHPMVIDFGVAKATNQKLTEKTLFTHFAAMIGTPAYMSPEQAEMSKLDVDTRSDIYSLGVVLYELLTGTTPFPEQRLRSAGYGEMQRIIAQEEPERPSNRLSTMDHEQRRVIAGKRGAADGSLSKTFAGDLDWIVMKCLEKDRARRYETANGLAIDIQRHLSNEPVVARPPSALYRFQKMVRRNKLGFAAGAAVGGALLVGLGVSFWQFEEARGEAANNRQVAQFLKTMLKGLGPSVSMTRDTKVLRGILDKAAEATAKDLINQPTVALELRTTIADTYGDLGLLDAMEQMAREDLKLARALFGQKNALAAEALYQIGQVEMSRGNLGEAEHVIRESLEMRRNLFGAEHPEVARSLVQMGRLTHEQGDWRGALAYVRQALGMQRKLLGNETADVAETLDAVALNLRLGALEEAEAAARQALAIKRKLFGEEHPAVEGTLGLLGMILKEEAAPGEQGKLAEAEAVCREALAMSRKLFSKAQVDIRLNGLGSVLLLEGKLTEAEPLLRDAVAACRDSEGDASLHLAWALHRLGGLSERQEKWNEAEAAYREAFLIRRRASVNPHLGKSLPRVLRNQGKNSEADAVFQEYIKAAGIAAEAGDIEAQSELAWILATSTEAKERDGRRAVIFGERAVAASQNTNPVNLDRLAAAYAEDGQFDKAIATEKKAVGLRPNNKEMTSRLSLYQSKTAYREP